MASKIEWTDETWNPFVGCTKVSPGCENCYAARMASRFPARWGNVAKGGEWTGRIEEADAETWDKPYHWRKPRRVFVCSMSDVFHSGVNRYDIERIMDIASECPAHTFQILTKRAKEMVKYFSVFDHPPKNVWLGVTVENQEQADARIPFLLQIPAAVRFVSVEPMLGPVNLAPYIGFEHKESPLHWVICGGESGPGARPTNPEWVRDLRDTCEAYVVPFMFKQWGEWAEASPLNFHGGMPYEEFMEFLHKHNRPPMVRVGKKAAGRELDGKIWNEFPR